MFATIQLTYALSHLWHVLAMLDGVVVVSGAGRNVPRKRPEAVSRFLPYMCWRTERVGGERYNRHGCSTPSSLPRTPEVLGPGTAIPFRAFFLQAMHRVTALSGQSG
jgi:hypothetical protein